MNRGNRCPKISGGMATTPCGASRAPKRCALPKASAIESWAKTPVGSPKSRPMEKTWRLRTPPPTPMMRRSVSSRTRRASTTGYVTSRPASMMERPPIFTTCALGSIRTTDDSVDAITSLSRRLSRMSIEFTWCRLSFVPIVVTKFAAPRQSAVMTVPTCSPSRARVKFPLTSPLIT